METISLYYEQVIVGLGRLGQTEFCAREHQPRLTFSHIQEGKTMSIQYFAPLTHSFDRMKHALFNPMDLRKWFVVGFAAFLAGLTDAQFNGSFFSNWKGQEKPADIFSLPQNIWEWLQQHPLWIVAIAVIIFLAIVIGVLLSWVSARGKFVFLDNIVHNRMLIAAPWHEYRLEANSFFLWNLLFGVISAAICLPYLIYCFISLKNTYDASHDGMALIVPLLLCALGMIVIICLFGFIFLMLNAFVAPIMYRDRIRTGPAIEKFLPLLTSSFLYFLGYAFFLIFLALGIGMAIIFAGCATCCIGFVLLMIPYINAVILLPVSYTLRAFSIEFLEQFGPEYQVFPRVVEPPPDTQPVTQ
jgi:hypothetical protein